MGPQTVRVMASKSFSRTVRILALLLIWMGSLVAVGIVIRAFRVHYNPDAALTHRLEKRAQNVTIVRDDYGIPHILGKTRADTAFGLAYAHAQDDFPTIQAVVAASRGLLSRYHLSSTSLQNDFYAGLVRVNERAKEDYDTKISPELRAMFEGYADGLNYYAALHSDEVDGRFFPVSGLDLARGFIHKIPLFSGAGQQLGKALAAKKADVEKKDAAAIDADPFWNALRKGLENPYSLSQDAIAALRKEQTYTAFYEDYTMVASNAHAVSAIRSADKVNRLNVNSHQPWDGPVAWYEAHLKSEDGYEMYGATFPGSPLLFVGHNKHLGWTHTVNTPDLIDLYRLDTNEEETEYTVDGEKLPLKSRDVTLHLDLFFFEIPVSRTVYDTIFGPALSTDSGIIAIRIAGLDRHIASAEQWYRMSDAQNFAEWQKAMELQAIPMFHTIYADATNIAYVYNALLPVRTPGPDYAGVIPGNTRKWMWIDYLTYRDLPKVINPPSGFVQNGNSTPFYTTLEPYNPKRKDNIQFQYIEDRLTNRALRSLAQFGGDKSITRAEFLRYKFDRKYDKAAPIYQEAVDPVLERFHPTNALEKRAIEILRNWDGTANPQSKGAMLAFLTWRPIWKSIVVDRKPIEEAPDPLETFHDAIDYLLDTGNLDDELQDRQKLIRGDTVLPMGGGPDVLNAMHMRPLEGWMGWLHPEWQEIYAGDSFIMLVEFKKDGIESYAAQPYGSSMRPNSPHFADQAPIFQKRILRRTAIDVEELDFRTMEQYHPGQEEQPH